jgi:hypothetical protein
MRKRKVSLCVMRFVLLVTVAAVAADAPLLTFKFTTVNVPGAVQTYPGGVNNAGVTVGEYIDTSGATHGYILKGKKLTTLDDPKAKAGTTAANNLNPDGAISVVGVYTGSNGNTVGFLYKNGKYTDIPGPTVLSAAADSINDSGEIVGQFLDTSGVTHGFLLKGQNYTTLNAPGATATVATGINKSGWIVVYWTNSSGTVESSLTKNKGKSYKTINVPGATSTYALDLNAAGDVTYEWLDSGGLAHGALLHAGKYYKFDHPKSVQTYGGGINDMGVIAGGFQATSGGPYSGFKATYK